MNRDRKQICNIISRMLDNPDSTEIYPTSTCYNELQHYIESVRLEAIGWAHADACTTLDKDDDPRLTNVPQMIERARVDLDI